VEKFVAIDAAAVPMLQANIDTDQIIPARFLQKPRKNGLQDYLFHDLRFDDSGAALPTFVLNDPRYSASRILIAGRNFGCGSSREAAVYALWDYGFRTVIAPSFGDIFYGNCLKNGLLPVQLSGDTIDSIGTELLANPGAHVQIDLDRQRGSSSSGSEFHFTIDGSAKHRLLHGLDELDYTTSLRQQIEAFESQSATRRPWL
jgi:3-isopropylmalate/(R)-2-methylmalate dehydratase small subunit